MGLLKEAFETLKLPDGRPDVVTQEAELSSLIDSLPLTHLRQLKSRFERMTMQKDVIAPLPAELVAMISQHLSLEDYLRARDVSKKWREVLDTPAVTIQVLEKYFPSALRSWKALGEEEQKQTKSGLSTTLVKEARLLLKCEYGKYNSMAAYMYPRQVEAGDEYYRDRYRNGRIAYQEFDERIYVKNLSTNVAKEYLFPNREKIIRWDLSDDFVVGAATTPPRLRAWSLDDDDADFEIRLPNRCAQLFLHGKHVGIITKCNECMVWEIGGAIKALEVSIEEQPQDFGLSSAKLLLFDCNDMSRWFMLRWIETKSSHRPKTAMILEFLNVKFQNKVYTKKFETSTVGTYWYISAPQARVLKQEEGTFGLGEGGIDLEREMKYGNGWSSRYDPLDMPKHILTFNIHTKRFGLKSETIDIDEKIYQFDEELFKKLIMPIGYSEKLWVPHTVDTSGVLCIDRRFAVLLRPRGYLVWCFDDTELPTGKETVFRIKDRTPVNWREMRRLFWQLESH